MAEPGQEAPLYFRNKDGKYPWSLLTWPGHYFIAEGSGMDIARMKTTVLNRNYQYRGRLQYMVGDIPEGTAVILVERSGITGPMKYERKATVNV